jgi:hypothetical protein
MSRQVPRGPDDLYCPYWRKKMSRVCHTCVKWMKLSGKHPQTGEVLDRYDCSDNVTALLQIEALQVGRGNQAAVESFRNEMVAQNERMIQAQRQQQHPRSVQQSQPIKEIKHESD